MKMIIAALLFLAPSLVSAASKVSIGDVGLEIPNPPGFVPVTPQMTALYDLHKRFVAPTNEEFIAFTPEATVPTAMRGEIPDLARRFAVQTAKALVNASASRSDFLKLKAIIKFQNDDLMKKVEKDLPGLMEQINKGISKHDDVNIALSLSLHRG